MADPRESMEAELEDAAPEAEAEDAPEVEQEAPEGQADPDLEQRARLLGWKPEAEWKGSPPPKGFMSAEQFVERFGDTPYEIQRLREMTERQAREFEERTRRLEAMNAKALERQRAQIEQRMDRAVEEGDADGYRAAKQELAGLQQPVPRETQEWMASNPWFGQDRIRTAAAMAAAEEAAQRGITDYAAQLQYVDRVISERFGGRAQIKRQTTSAVDAGGMQPPRPREKGVSDLPSEAKRAAAQLVKEGVYGSEAEYAKDYWAMERGEL